MFVYPEHGGIDFLTRITYSDGGGNVVPEEVSLAPALPPRRLP